MHNNWRFGIIAASLWALIGCTSPAQTTMTDAGSAQAPVANAPNGIDEQANLNGIKTYLLAACRRGIVRRLACTETAIFYEKRYW